MKNLNLYIIFNQSTEESDSYFLRYRSKTTNFIPACHLQFSKLLEARRKFFIELHTRNSETKGYQQKLELLIRDDDIFCLWMLKEHYTKIEASRHSYIMMSSRAP